MEEIQERRREEALTMPLPPPSKCSSSVCIVFSPHNRVFMDTMEYVKTFGQNNNRELVKAIRQYVLGSMVSSW